MPLINESLSCISAWEMTWSASTELFPIFCQNHTGQRTRCHAERLSSQHCASIISICRQYCHHMSSR